MTCSLGGLEGELLRAGYYSSVDVHRIDGPGSVTAAPASWRNVLPTVVA